MIPITLFFYPRQYHRTAAGEKKAAFFFPHENESGYWWQGENARLASLSAALNKIKPYVNIELAKKLDAIATASINWILGLNPYNICMLQGVGYYNPPEYDPEHPNTEGGICNGITGGFWDETSISFAATDDPSHSWRWSEQWIPNSGWFLLAISL